MPMSSLRISFSLLPRTRWQKLRLGLALLVLAGVLLWLRPDRYWWYAMTSKQEGDILFQSLPHGDLVEAIEGISESEWSHCGVLVRENGRWMVAEAIGEVRLTPLRQWIQRGRRSKVVSYRLNSPPPNLASVLRPPLDPLLGRPYDFRYAPGDDEIYCSELVHLLYLRGAGIPLGTWQELGSLNWKPHEAFIRDMEDGALPLERPMVTPVSLTRDAKVRKVW
jgi:hypothetical protein